MKNLKNLFFSACETGQLEVVKRLVENGLDVNAGDNYAIRHSATNGHLDIVKYLVENGAYINAWGDAVLRWAEINKHLEIIEYLESVINNKQIDNQKEKN
jgi:ankyrin repeat protein